MPGQAEDRPGRDGDKDLNLAHLRGGRSQVAGRRGSSLSQKAWLLAGRGLTAETDRRTSAQAQGACGAAQLSSGLCFLLCCSRLLNDLTTRRFRA